MDVRNLMMGSVVIALAACGGGGGSPSDPNPGQALMMELLLENADGQATLQRVTVFFDGVHMGTATIDTASRTTPPMHTNPFAAPGNHVLRVTVEAQTDSPNRYTLSGSARWGTRDVDLGRPTATLATGESIEVQITL